MALDNCAYDREAHTHSLGFGREERVKQLRHVLGSNADARVANRYMHAPGFALARTYLDLAWSAAVLADGVEGIQNQIHQRLNELCPVADDRRKRNRQIDTHRDILEHGIACEDAFDVKHYLLEIDRRHLRFASLKECTNISDGFDRP